MKAPINVPLGAKAELTLAVTREMTVAHFVAAMPEVYGTPMCGKGEPGQLIRVGHASPACVFADVEVFGGA